MAIGLGLSMVCGCQMPFSPDAAVLDQATFSLDYPKTWRARLNSVDSPIEVISPIDGPEDIYYEHVQVGVTRNEEGLSLEELYRQQFNPEVMGRLLHDFQIISSSNDRIGRYLARRTVYTHRPNAGRKFRVLTYLVPIGSQTYLFSCTAEDDAFEDYRKDFEQICHSFRLRRPTGRQTPTTQNP